jgi:hypothetical protein
MAAARTILLCCYVGSGDHPASYTIRDGDFFNGVKRPDPEAETHLHQVLRLRMRGAIISLPQNVFVAYSA